MCKKQPKAYRSSNLQYKIFLNYPGVVPEETCVLYARNPEANLFDLAKTIYTDCFDNLHLRTPLRLHVYFYGRSSYYIFIISDNTSLANVLKQIAEQFQI